MDRAADLIQERGWEQYGGWLAATLDAGPLCIEGAIMAAANVKLHALKRTTDGRTAEQVIATLRACSAVEATKELSKGVTP